MIAEWKIAYSIHVLLFNAFPMPFDLTFFLFVCFFLSRDINYFYYENKPQLETFLPHKDYFLPALLV